MKSDYRYNNIGKVKITKDGFLEIERAGQFRLQECPFAEGASLCGDWCPLFGEPYFENRDCVNPENDTHTLELCHNKIQGCHLIDERTLPTKEEELPF